jgi:Flp pilus assembly pilin Flp
MAYFLEGEESCMPPDMLSLLQPLLDGSAHKNWVHAKYEYNLIKGVSTVLVIPYLSTFPQIISTTWSVNSGSTNGTWA